MQHRSEVMKRIGVALAILLVPYLSFFLLIGMIVYCHLDVCLLLLVGIFLSLLTGVFCKHEFLLGLIPTLLLPCCFPTFAGLLNFCGCPYDQIEPIVIGVAYGGLAMVSLTGFVMSLCGKWRWVKGCAVTASHWVTAMLWLMWVIMVASC